MNYSELATPFGAIGVSWQGQLLTRVLLAPDLTPDLVPDLAPDLAPESAPELDRADSQAPARSSCASTRDRQTGAAPQAPASSRPETPAWLRAEMEAYFADPRHGIRCAIDPAGTSFQRQVWALIAAIPPGRHRTYGALAKQLRSSARAVGNACRANPVPLCIPCHRVIASKGLGGFAGDRSGRLIEIKRWLLEHEAALSSEPFASDGLFEDGRAQ